jgi:REP element-mobilizing transposase RayT
MFVPPEDISVRVSQRKKLPEEESFHVTRRHLPHWTTRGATYFVTFRTRKGILDGDEQEAVLKHVKEADGKFYDLRAAVVMPDHVHLLLTPEGEYSLSRIMKGIKGGSARTINTMRHQSGQVWQHESYDRIVRDENELLEKVEYMFNNPLKAGLTDDPLDYPGSYFSDIREP